MKELEPGIRNYTCKRCGVFQREPNNIWKKKKTTLKNVCPKCIESRRVAIQTAIEKGRHAGYGGLYIY